MSKPYVKITFQDIEIAEEFFNNEKHLEEFLTNVVRYYRGLDLKIKTKIVEKYFKTYKKTMDFIINSKQFGEKGAQRKAENQEVGSSTLEGMVEAPLEGTLPTNIKDIIVNKEDTTEPEKFESTEHGSVVPLTLFEVPKKSPSRSSSEPSRKTSLYARLIDVWFTETHPSWQFSKVDGAKMKSIINKIENIFDQNVMEKTDDSIVDFFRLMCNNLSDFYKDKELKVIEGSFNTVVEQLKNTGNGQQKQNTGNRTVSRYRIVPQGA